jgi:uncharacterized protein YbjT (DUF2867 family)
MADHNWPVTTTDLVTGAFGFTGSRLAERLLAAGRDVRTLTRRQPPADHPLAARIAPFAYDFAPAPLREALAGVDTLYITYWMRFARRGGQTWPEVIANVGALVRAAAASGVRRVIYISVSNAAPDALTAYFRAKAAAEQQVSEGGIGYTIVRPTLLYGEADILINNMAWTLRRLPMFGVPGDGRYRVQPVYVGDVADVCFALAASETNQTIDACGPEIFEFNDLVRTVGRAIGAQRRLLHLPPAAVLATTRVMGFGVRDVVLTRDEIRELMAGLLTSTEQPNCSTRFSDWLAANAAEVGRRYQSELGRNFRLSRAEGGRGG